MTADFEQEEYFAIVKAVADFDQRLLVVKGWGVTLSLVALGLGFQYRAYGFFMVACASSLAFWLVEAAVRRHQMRHYLRMREIEVNQYTKAGEADKGMSAPRMDWSWQGADHVYSGKRPGAGEIVQPRRRTRSYGWGWGVVLPHVMLPHSVTLLVGLVLLILGFMGRLPQFSLGPGTATPPPIGGL